MDIFSGCIALVSLTYLESRSCILRRRLREACACDCMVGCSILCLSRRRGPVEALAILEAVREEAGRHAALSGVMCQYVGLPLSLFYLKLMLQLS